MKRTLSILAVVGMLTLLVVLMIAVVPVSAAPKDKVTICHKPGTPAQKTMQVPEDAVADHLGHGDYLDACSEEPLPEPPEPVISGTVKVTICHKPGTPAQKTLVLPEAALGGHLGHGDVLTPCEELELPEPPEPPGPLPTDTVKITICHKPDKQAKTLIIGEDGVEDHLGHGDYLGPCEAESEVPLEWVLPTQAWLAPWQPAPL